MPADQTCLLGGEMQTLLNHIPTVGAIPGGLHQTARSVCLATQQQVAEFMGSRVSQDDDPGDVGRRSKFFRRTEKDGSIRPTLMVDKRLAKGFSADIPHCLWLPRENSDYGVDTFAGIAGDDAAPAHAHLNREAAARQNLLHRG
jgi:hypothetical protein